MSERKVRLGIVGCGNIAGPYVKDLVTGPEVEVAGVADLDQARAEALASEHGVRAYPNVAALLADPGVEVVVNLTVHHAHLAVTAASLNAGKHVYSEKPLAMTYSDARSLVNLADDKGLRLACSPFTALGEAQQTAWKWLREERLGRLRLAYAEVNWGRLETWHPAPEPFYEVGPLFDVGVYPLTVLTTMFGPACQVWAYGTVVYPERRRKDGEDFRIETPDLVVAMIEMTNGLRVRLTTNFYASTHTRQRGIEFHGDKGSLYLDSWLSPGSKLEYADFDKTYEPVPLVKEPSHPLRWGRGVRDLAESIVAGKPHRLPGEQAAHIVEVLCAIADSVKRRGPVQVTSSFMRPEPMEWARG